MSASAEIEALTKKLMTGIETETTSAVDKHHNGIMLIDRIEKAGSISAIQGEEVVSAILLGAKQAPGSALRRVYQDLMKKTGICIFLDRRSLHPRSCSNLEDPPRRHSGPWRNYIF